MWHKLWSDFDKIWHGAYSGAKHMLEDKSILKSHYWKEIQDLGECPGHYYYMNLDVPGVSDEDIEIKCGESHVEVSAKSSEETLESRSHYYKYNFPSDADIDTLVATCKNGVLKLRVNKKEEEKPVLKQIKISK